MIKTSIQRPVTVSMVTIGVIAFGLISLTKLPINLLPDLSYPTLTLETRFPGAAPEEVEYLVTRQLEEGVAVIPNIKRITSSSKPELSQVMIEFQWGRQMDFAVLDVSKKIDLLRFPEGVEKPRILRYDPNQEPIMKVSVTGTMPLTELRFFCEEDLKKRLDGVPGLASVKVNGGREEIIEVHLDEAALKRFGLSIEEVTNRLRQENINRAGGSLYENEARYLVRTLNEFRSLEDIGGTIVSRKGDRRIYLHEIADIRYGHKDQEQISRINGEEGVELAFYKEGDANTVTVSQALNGAIQRLQEQFEGQLVLKTTYQGASFIEQAVNEVKSNAILGGIIAILVLLTFLRDFKGTLIVGFAIPISVMATFFLMLQFGVSMNIMSLGGLALGVGMLVDNSIVVLESIYVRRSLGDDPVTAASKGTGTVAGAVVASTLTTIVVFLPIVFISGVGGQLFRDLGLTVSFSLGASLVVSLTLMPTLFALFAKKPWIPQVMLLGLPFLSAQIAKLFRGKKSAKATTALDAPIDEVEASAFAGNLYSRLLTLALRFRYVVLIVAVLLVYQAANLWEEMGLSLVPEMSQGDYFVLLENEEGTPIAKTDRIASWIEDQLLDIDGIQLVFSNIGSIDQGVESRTGENLAQVNFSLKEVSDPGRVLTQVREKLDAGPDLSYQIRTPSYFSFRTPIEVEVYNENRDALERVTADLVAEMAAISSLKDIKSTVAEGNPEVRVTFEREAMSRMGLSIGDISALLRDKIQGANATRFVRGGRDVDVMVRLREEDRDDLGLLENMTVGYADGRPIFLGAVAKIDHEVGPAQIKRIDQRRGAVVTAGVIGGDIGGAGDALLPVIDRLNAKYPDAFIQVSGQNAEMKSAFQSLMFAIILAVFLVYLVMASQFESLTHPFLILFTIPIGMVGGLMALYFSGLQLSVIALIGLVMLAGIVVNNAIVLIDYLNQLRRRGKNLYDALIIAGNRRLRPIFMTTMTTVLGLVPMAMGLGSGAEMRRPLAIAVIGGLVFSTVLTLIIIPVIYGIVNRGLRLPATQKRIVEQEVAA